MTVTFNTAVYQISAKLTNLVLIAMPRYFEHFRYLDCLNIDYDQSFSTTEWIR